MFSQITYYTTPLLLLAALLGLNLQQHPYLSGTSIFLTSAYLLFCHYKRKNKTILYILLLFLAIATLSPLYLILRSPTDLQFDDSPTTKILTLKEEPVQKNQTYHALATDSQNHDYILYTKYPMFYGDTYSIQGKFMEVLPPTNPGEPNYKNYLLQHHISGLIYATAIKKHGLSTPSWYKKIAFDLRNRIITTSNKTLPKPYDNLYVSLVFGDTGAPLPDDLKEQFQKTGLTHLLVVSGAQVALLSGILESLLLATPLGPLTRFICITFCNLLFLVMTGGEASILRAVIMCELALGLNLLIRTTSIYHILSLTALIMLLLNPHSLWDLGAQLSFVATISLIFGAPKLETILPKKLPESLRKAIALSLAPFIITTPLIWYAFSRMSLISIVSNLLVISWVELIVVIGFFSSIIGFIYLPLAQLLNNASLAFMMLLNCIVSNLQKIPGATINLISPNLLELGLLWTSMILIFKSIEKKHKKALTLSLFFCISILVICLIPTFAESSPQLKVTILDVGQGDSILIETPHNKRILIDAGARFYDRKTHELQVDMGKRVVLPALINKGINSLDLLIITHFDSDHVGGAPYLLTHIPIKTIMDNGGYNPAFKDYARYLNEHPKLTHLTGQEGQTITLEDNLILTILHPFPNTRRDPHENNNCIVVKLTYGTIDFLFTGDLEEIGENALIQRHAKDLACEVLKLGHHGSKTSSCEAFLNHVRPRIAIVSAGRHNHYHHPAPSVVSRVNAHNIPILRTDEQGSIEISTDGKTLRYKTYRSRFITS
ncbi:MAG: DNA internalization-related competence protein ComEC/Rec2 [Candidatus Margulisbacteria bacterium]|nr:DNA internalization-related competence protein ComEC/Rec2 [Candidatus Margulisiibacteriota bacterium]